MTVFEQLLQVQAHDTHPRSAPAPARDAARARRPGPPAPGDGRLRRRDAVAYRPSATRSVVNRSGSRTRSPPSRPRPARSTPSCTPARSPHRASSKASRTTCSRCAVVSAISRTMCSRSWSRPNRSTNDSRRAPRSEPISKSQADKLAAAVATGREGRRCRDRRGRERASRDRRTHPIGSPRSLRPAAQAVRRCGDRTAGRQQLRWLPSHALRHGGRSHQASTA